MKAIDFINELASIQLINVFNPYGNLCTKCDKLDGISIRKSNLENYLLALEEAGTETIWLGRDLGYRGGRRTGLALTDEVHLPFLSQYFNGKQFNQATQGERVSERTAIEIWNFIRKIPETPLLWNVFPLHPHLSDDEFTNRKFTNSELSKIEHLNAELIDWFKIKKIIAIGADANKFAKRFNLHLEQVRHPSYGGTNEFRLGMRKLYELKDDSDQRTQALFD